MKHSEKQQYQIWQFCHMISALDVKWTMKHFIEGEPIYQETLEDSKRFVKEMTKWLDSQDVTQYPKKPV